MYTVILLTAFGLLLVFEGLMPFLVPQYWRRFILEMSSRSDRQLRLMGLGFMLVGLALILLVHFRIL